MIVKNGLLIKKRCISIVLDQSSNTIISLWKEYHKIIRIHVYIKYKTLVFLGISVYFGFSKLLTTQRVKTLSRWRFRRNQKFLFLAVSLLPFYMTLRLLWYQILEWYNDLSTFKQTDLATFLDFVDCTIVPSQRFVMILVKGISYRISSNDVFGLSSM